MSADDEIIAMDGEIAHGSMREAELERLPGVTIVERNINGGFRAGIEQTMAQGIFANDVGRSVVGDTAGDLGPSGSEIARTVDVRVEIVEAKTIDRGIRCAGIEVRGFNDGDFAPRLELWRGDVLPIFPAIACELDYAIVGASPNGIDFFERWRDGVDRAAMLTFFGVAGFEGTEIAREFIGCAGEVGTDDGPTTALIGRFEQNVGGEVEGMGIEV